MTPQPLTGSQVADYHQDGYCFARGFFDSEEIELLQKSAREDRVLDDHSFGKNDGEGGQVRLSLWNHPGEGIYGMFARCERMVNSAEAILDDEVYHYHSKMIMKDPEIGGAWTWHQDYG
ncbi:MAG: phytanoyl-CoA dioxygenase family protein, partial [Planctomycetota bacterium]|nr:phytanoyl-CoA dioxygenase family protein [Planctomycetota bacterium]